MRRQLLKKYTVLIARTGQTPVTLNFNPLSALVLLFILAAVPVGWLTTVIFSLSNSNLQLSKENQELSEKAYQVLNELDTLDSEIDNLKERAGLEDTDISQTERQVSNYVPPRGGLENSADALSLYQLAEQRMPQLNAALDDNVKPALEDTLEEEKAREAAYPDGKPLNIPLVVTSEFGFRPNPFGGRSYEKHNGIDFTGPYGTPIVATGDGTIVRSDYYGGYGKAVVIDHGYGLETLYAHMSELELDAGTKVNRGEVIGYLGSTGRSSGPHLHYTIYHNGEAVNPREYLTLNESSSVADYWMLR